MDPADLQVGVVFSLAPDDVPGAMGTWEILECTEDQVVYRPLWLGGIQHTMWVHDAVVSRLFVIRRSNFYEDDPNGR